MKMPVPFFAAVARRAVFVTIVATLPLSAQTATPATDRVDLDALYKIKEEGLQRSQVMEITSFLTDVYGPRLTNSPNIKAAGEWTRQKLTEWGLVNARLEPWGPFGRVVTGMEVVDRLNGEYAEAPSKGQGQMMIQTQGNAFLQANFPNLDYVKKATIVVP